MADEDEIVVGMAEAIERRRLELGLSPGEFADAAGVTAEGLRPIRKGYRRRYQDKVKRGVARALKWPLDCVDRLLAGEDAAGFPTVVHGRGRLGGEVPAALSGKLAELSAEDLAYIEGLVDRLLGGER